MFFEVQRLLKFNGITKTVDTDYDILVKAMDKIMNSVDFIDELRVLVDPFMYKELGKIIINYQHIKMLRK